MKRIDKPISSRSASQGSIRNVNCLPAAGQDVHKRISAVAVLLIDVINPMNFEGANLLLPPAVAAAQNIARFREHARHVNVPVIYVNDNFDCWHLGFRELVDRFRAQGVPGLPLIELLAPEAERDFYILKPSHSGFFRTGLEVLLERLQARTLVLTGFAGDICVLFTANDAYMRGFSVCVPPDCVASERAGDNAHALSQMRRLLKVNVVESTKLDLQQLCAQPGPGARVQQRKLEVGVV